MTVSVAMATYNGERFLEEQLASIERQTLQPSELVVYDDGSTDRTRDVLETFAERSSFPVRVRVNESRLGYADTFLRAAGECASELTAFCDQDDVWLPNKVERCVAALSNQAAVLAMHSCRVADERLVATRKLYPRFATDAIAPPLSTDPWLGVRGMAMVFRTSILRHVDSTRRPPSHYVADATVNHDEWVYLLARGVGAIVLLAEPLALYRRHGGAVTGEPQTGVKFSELARIGWWYYSRRRGQAIALAEAFDGLVTLADPPLEPERSRVAAASYRELAARLETRLAVYEPETRRIERARRLARLVRDGSYGPFGIAAIARDAAMIALGRTG